MKKHKALKITAIVLAALLVTAAVAFFVYTGNYYRATERAQSAGNRQGITVTEQKGYISVEPEDGGAAQGYIFYPGALVEAQAYLPYLAAVAENGIYCAVIQPAFHLAIFSQNAADRVIEANPGIESWAVGGHSLGGVVASGYAAKHEAVSALVLLASYPNTDLSSSGLAVLSITASGDEVLNQQSYTDSTAKLPEDTRYELIDGGNHAGFGDYGEQKGDGPALLTAEDQNYIAAQLTVELFTQENSPLNFHSEGSFVFGLELAPAA